MKSYNTIALIFTMVILIGIGSFGAALATGDWRYLLVSAMTYYLIVKA